MSFKYVDRRLSVVQEEGVVDLFELAKTLTQPFYVYDLDGIDQRLELFQKSMGEASIHYAMKANDNMFILKRFARNGLGVDVVSGGEIDRALQAGFPADRIVFSGVGKTRDEIEKAVTLGIKQINVESPQELLRISEIAQNLKLKARVALRMNPDVNPVTHPYIKTGFRENKFGMDESFLPELVNILRLHPESLDLVGLTMHIGSQIRELSPMAEALDKMLGVYNQLQADGWDLRTFDVGGGVGIHYEKDPDESEDDLIRQYGEIMRKGTKSLKAEILCEPGRILVARYGLLLGQVQYIKETPYKTFAILNTGMHHLMRPALYQAYHRIAPVLMPESEQQQLYQVVGPICESADVIGSDRMLPTLHQDDWLAICDTGAYGFVMASRYNAHDLPPEYVISEGKIL